MYDQSQGFRCYINNTVDAGGITGDNNRVGNIEVSYGYKKLTDPGEWLSLHASVLNPPEFNSEDFADRQTKSIFGLEQFQRCLKGKAATLVIEGSIGVGKTTTILGLAEKVRSFHNLVPSEWQASSDQNIPDKERTHTDISEEVQIRPIVTVDVYFKATERDQHSPSRVLMLILQSLVRAMPEHIKLVQDLQKQFPNSKPTPEHIAKTIVQVLEGDRQICIFLDGLDECDPGSLPIILKTLKRIQKNSRIGLVLTERSETGRWREYFTVDCLHSLEANRDDMKAYLQHRFKKLVAANPNRYGWIIQDESLYADAVDRILESSGHIFLLLVLNFEYICKCHGRDDLQFSLGTIKRQDCDMDGHGSYKRVLDEAFTRNIHRALDDSNNGEDAKQILGFIRDVKRPLSAAELCELVRIRIPYDKPVHGSLPLWETLQPYCQGLVVANDKEVNFLHPSLRNFLEHNDGKILIPSQHEQLAKRCCAYLTLDCCSGGVRTTQESLNHRLEAWPFLDYAARYWPEHIRCLEELDKTQSRSMNPGSVYGLALQFLKQDAHVQASTQITLFPDLVLRKMQKEIARNSNLPRTLILVKGKEEAKPIDPFKNNEMTGLHLACLHNLRCLVPILLTEGRPSSQLGQLATAPISMAPIHLAAISGCKETMRMLLEANLDPGLQASNGTTPLMLATMSGHHDVVSTLLSADQTKATIDTQTVALISPIEMAVELNLRNGPNDAFALDLLNIYRPVTGRTALHCAAREGHLKILRLLLQAKANMTLQDSQGQTALHKAAKKGHLMVLQELISEGMDPHVKVAETPESLLAKLNPLRWFRTIDQTGEPSNDSYDGYHGWNILHLASSYSRSNAIVKHVLKSFPQLCEATNSRGETPLYLAIVNEAFQNVQTLLEYRPSLVHAVTHNGRTMLHAAARSSPVAILEMIFERCNVDINVEDDQGATPLHNAVEFMNVKNVEFLLSKDGINVNHRDKNGVSVTIKGVLSFNQLIMEMFHKHPQVKLDIQDGDIIFMSSTTIGRRIIRQTIDEEKIRAQATNALKLVSHHAENLASLRSSPGRLESPWSKPATFPRTAQHGRTASTKTLD